MDRLRRGAGGGDGAISAEFGACTGYPNPTDPSADSDDNFCTDGNVNPYGPGTFPLYNIIGCTLDDLDFDGPPYQVDWPGTNPNPTTDVKYHGTPNTFTSPTFNGNQQYSRVAFEVDMPRVEVTDNPPCNRVTGQYCVNPYPGANFYPIFSTNQSIGNQCVWKEGGQYFPKATNTFGGNSTTEYGPLYKLFYPLVAHVEYLYEDFHNGLSNNPCPAPK